jgi:hypothetical protein
MSGMKDALGDSEFEYRETAPKPAMPKGIPEDVAKLYEKLALDVIATGRVRYSSDAILHRIRWFHHVERGDVDFKCNDHWTAPLARWFMGLHPSHAGFFETRVRKSAGGAA